jgi:hypothetical protein
MFKRTLGLSTPELVGGYLYDAKAISLFSHASHGTLLALRAAADKLSPNYLPTEMKLIGGEKLAILWRGHADDCSG